MTRAEGKRPGLDRGASLEGEAPMTRTTTSRPRMAATYAPGTVRARRWHGEGDVRGYRPPSGWCGCWYQLDTVPVRTGHGAGAGQVAGVQSSGMSAFDCGFNGSMQRFVEIVRPAFHGLASSGDDRSTLSPRHRAWPAISATGPFPWGSTAAARRWCSLWNRSRQRTMPARFDQCTGSTSAIEPRSNRGRSPYVSHRHSHSTGP